MKHVVWGLALMLAATTAGAVDLETVLGKIEENRAKLDNCAFQAESEIVRHSTEGKETLSNSRDTLKLADGKALQESESTTRRGEQTTQSKSRTGWDGAQSYSLRPGAAGATTTLTINTTKTLGALHGQIFPSVATWKNEKDAKIEETADGKLRLSSPQRTTILDPKLDYAVLLDASSRSIPMLGNRTYSSVALYKNYKRSLEGAWYPTEVVSFSPPQLDLASVGLDVTPPDSGNVTTRRVVSVDHDYKGEPNLGKIEPQTGWQVNDYARSGVPRQAIQYVFRPGLTDADIEKMSADQKAEAERRTTEAAARRKAQEEAKAALLDNPHPTLASLQFLSGPVADAKSLEGKVVLVDFWATWCGPCRNSIPHLKTWQDQYGAEGLVVLGISKEKTDVVKPFVEKEEMQYAIAIDEGGAVSSAYGVSAIPQFYLIDRNGLVVYQKLGAGGYDQIEAKFKELLAQKAEGRYQARPLASEPTRTSQATP